MESVPTKALSLWAPWAWACLFAGKPVENRTWAPSPHALSVGERFWLHASLWGKKPDDMLETFQAVRAIYERTGFDVRGSSSAKLSLADLDSMRGKVLGSVRYLGAVRRWTDPSPWFVGPVGWLIDDPRPLATPIACRGAQGLWTVPEAVLAQLPEAA